MEVLGLIIIALIWFFKAAVANEDKKVNDRETGKTSASPEMLSPDELIKKANRAVDDLDTMRAVEREKKKRPSGAQIRDFHRNLAAQERAGSEKRWEIARKKQADRGEVHSVHMDSCENRLENLKVLYDAGILDREEYAQRVARVKKAHAQSRS